MDKETIDGMINVGYVDLQRGSKEFGDVVDALQAVEIMKYRIRKQRKLYQLMIY